MISFHFDIGKIYRRVIKGLMQVRGYSMMDALFFAYHSPMADKLNHYNSSFYYDTPQSILRAFLGLEMVGRMVNVIIDRPKGSTHPEHVDMIYPIHYGYVKEFLGGDGEAQDAYVLGVEEQVSSVQGVVIAVIHRKDDVEEKWVVAPLGAPEYTAEEIKQATLFTEQYFDSEIWM